MPVVTSYRTSNSGNGWFQNNTTGDQTTVPMYVGRNSIPVIVTTWMNFPNLNIPAGSTINSATFTFQQNSTGNTSGIFHSQIAFHKLASPNPLEGGSTATMLAAYNARTTAVLAVDGAVAESVPVAYDVTAALQEIAAAFPTSDIVSATLLWYGTDASSVTIYCRPENSGIYNHSLAVDYTPPAVAPNGPAAGTFPALTGTGAGDVPFIGAVAGALPALTGAGVGDVPFAGAATGTLPALTGAAAGFQSVDGAVAGTLPALTGTATGDFGGVVGGAASGALPAIAGAAAGMVEILIAGTGALPLPVGAATGLVEVLGAGSGQLPALTGAASATAGVITVTLADLMADEIRPMDRGRNRGSVKLTGTYAGPASAIQAQVVDSVTAAVIVDWTTLDAAPTGGAFAGTILTPGGSWYKANVRAANDVTAVSSGVNRWAVGVLIGITGQSNGQRLTSEVGTVVVTTAQPVRVFSSVIGDLPAGETYSVWHQPTGQGVCAMANMLGDRLGYPVGILQDAYGGAALRSEADSGGTGWWWDGSPSGASTHWPRFLGHLNQFGNNLTAMVWVQGEREAQTFIAPTTYDKYIEAFTAFLANYVRPATRADLPVFVTTLPRYSGTGTDRWDDVIRAQFRLVDTLSNVFMAGHIRDVQMADTVHVHVNSEDEFGQRIARAILDCMGETDGGRGPRPVAFTQVNGTTFDVHCRLHGGNGLRPEGATQFEGFEVLDGAVARTITGAARQDAQTVRLTVSATVASPVVRFLYGANPAGIGAGANQPKDEGPLALPLEPVGVIPARRTIAYTVVDRNGTAQPNLTGLRWAFHESHPDQGGAPSDTGTATTNGAGALAVPLNYTHRLAGDTGWLTLTDAAGTNTATVLVTLA